MGIRFRCGCSGCCIEKGEVRFHSIKKDAGITTAYACLYDLIY